MAYGVLMLTGVNLLLRFAGTWFQVYLSRTIGPEGIGLLQLTMSVGSFALVAGMAGIRTAAMYLTAEELGKKQRQGLPWVLSGCIRYSLICSGSAALVLALLAPWLAERWIGDSRVTGCLILFAGFLPISCLCGVFSGFFTASQRVGTLAAVEVAEQILSMSATLALLALGNDREPGAATRCVITGSGLGACLTLVCLWTMRMRETASPGSRVPGKRRITAAAVPLALGDVVKSGINTAENLLVPRRLELHRGTGSPLGAFGIVTGMVFPVLMFPACILFALADLLIPEMARCSAAGNQQRVRYLARRAMKLALVYALIFGGGMMLVAPDLCLRLYENQEAGIWLRRYALMVPMLYTDAIVDAMVKGLGQQKTSVRYNILTAAMDVSMLFFLLPRFGMTGYYWSFLISHGVNFVLSIRLLTKLTGIPLPLWVPLSALAAAAGAIWASIYVADPLGKVLGYIPVLLCLLTLFGVISREDIQWIRGLLPGKRTEKSPVSC